MKKRIIIHDLPGFLIRRAQQIATSVFMEETRKFDVTPIQFGVLHTLTELPGLDQITLASRMGIDTATLALLIERLEKKGYVARVPDAADRRRKLLSITPAGIKIASQMQPQVARVQQRILAPLTAKERAEFLWLLSKLVDANNDLSRAPLKT